MTTWLPSALLSLLSFGFWGLFSKLALIHIDSRSALIFQTAGVMIVGLVALGFFNFKPDTSFKGMSYGLLTGLAYGIGCLFYLVAADKGKITTVVTLTALYPLVTLVLSWFLLKEGINLKQMAGIMLALVAIFLMAS